MTLISEARQFLQKLDTAGLRENATQLGIWPFVESLLQEADRSAD